MNTPSPLAGPPSAVAVLRNSSSSRPEPSLPDELANPATKHDLLKKIEVVLKTASQMQREALVMLKMIITEQVHVDQHEVANTNYYDRLVNQVICGERTKASLASRINEVNGLPYNILAYYNLPLLYASADPPKAPEKPRFFGWGR